MIARLRRSLHEDDAGFSLVELLVAVLITSMVMTMVGAFYVNIARSTASAKASRNAMGQTSLAVAAVRSAVTMASDNGAMQAVTAGTSSSITVVSYSNTSASAVAPSLVTFALDASGYLSETRQAGVLGAAGAWVFTGAVTTRRVAGPFLTGSGTPFFSYVDSSGSVISLVGSGLAASDLGRVAFVRVTAKVANTTISGASDPIVATTSIGLTNVTRNIGATTTLPALTGGR